MSARVQQACDELEAARLLVRDDPEAVFRMLGVLAMKFAWVGEQPYTLWILTGPQDAAQFLAAHDAAVAAGTVPHRVTSYMAGPAGPAGSAHSFRDDMQSFADGGGMSGPLRAELNAYRLCKLDDTWAESSHRDLTRITRKSTAEDLPWTASTYRLNQNLKYVDRMQPHQVRRFAWLFYWWKAIARRSPIVRRGKHVVCPVRKGR